MEDSDLELWVQSLTPPIPRSINGSGDGPKAVLLTGCSGFLGRHLLVTLLQHPGCSRVYCHTRGRTKGERVGGMGEGMGREGEDCGEVVEVGSSRGREEGGRKGRKGETKGVGGSRVREEEVGKGVLPHSWKDQE